MIEQFSHLGLGVKNWNKIENWNKHKKLGQKFQICGSFFKNNTQFSLKHPYFNFYLFIDIVPPLH